MSSDQSLDRDGLADIKIAGEKPLSWFDVSAMGTGEMLFTAGWAWVVYIGSLYGTKWTLIAFFGGALVIGMAWWLYREMITAVPEPGSLQSYAREAGVFSIGTAYLILYAPVYGAFMWLELFVMTGLLSQLFPEAPSAIWPYVVLVPVVLINLLGHQITGKLQSILVVITLIGDILLAILVWTLLFDSNAWVLNWDSPTPMDILQLLTAIGLWIGIMAGVMEVQQVLVDEWRDFARSRDVGLISAAGQLWARQIPLAIGLFGALPLTALILMPVPTVGAVESRIGQGPIFYLAISMMLVATFTTLSVFFMGMSKIVALYAQQGALPRVFGRYSSRSVPWVAIVILALFVLVGAYWTDFAFVVHVLSVWSVTLYFFVALIYLLMRRRKDLDRPIVSRFGGVVGWALLAYTGAIGYAMFKADPKAFVIWFIVVAVVVAYDKFVVPRTKRGAFYRTQVLRRRTSADRL